MWTERHGQPSAFKSEGLELTALCLFSVPRAPTSPPAMWTADVCRGGCRAGCGHVPREAAASPRRAPLPSLQEQGWCEITAHLLALPEHDARQKVLQTLGAPGHLLGPASIRGYAARGDTGHPAGWSTRYWLPQDGAPGG